MVIIDNQPTRLWLGPLLLIFIVTLIYIFSVLPQTRSSIGMDPLPSHPSYGKSERIISSFRMVSDSKEDTVYVDEECNLHGYWNAVNTTCHCIQSFKGPRCATPVCTNGGISRKDMCKCPIGFGGQFCENRCKGGISQTINDTSHCMCEGNKFGPRCDYICMNGRVEGGECMCNTGYEGFSCEMCSSSTCLTPSSSIRRSSLNSRLTLSGLSFCLITIGLLCVTASRRRLTSSASDGLCSLRDIRNRSFPLRTSSHSSNIRPIPLPLSLTPPPIYRSLDNLPQGIAPPSYQEATAIQIDPQSDDEDKTNN